ncbi:MAG: hypothetical protein M3354_07430 [Chloroflexota bacterium]|nr:hypothetical protein [Chloroflexota bacterium]
MGIVDQVNQPVSQQRSVRCKAGALLDPDRGRRAKEIERQIDCRPLSRRVILQIGVEPLVAQVDLGGNGKQQHIEIKGHKVKRLAEPVELLAAGIFIDTIPGKQDRLAGGALKQANNFIGSDDEPAIGIFGGVRTIADGSRHRRMLEKRVKTLQRREQSSLFQDVPLDHRSVAFISRTQMRSYHRRRNPAAIRRVASINAISVRLSTEQGSRVWTCATLPRHGDGLPARTESSSQRWMTNDCDSWARASIGSIQTSIGSVQCSPPIVLGAGRSARIGRQHQVIGSSLQAWRLRNVSPMSRQTSQR